MARAFFNVPRVGRVIRRPQHSWHVRTKPFQLQPICLAPVLPGETLKNLLFQARVVTDPIRNALIGWYCEYYWFYVKLRDLDARDTLTQLMVEMNTSIASLQEARDYKWYNYPSSIPWAKLCLKRIVEEYFRDEGEAWNTWVIDGVPLAALNDKSWMHSALLQDNLTAVDVDVDAIGAGANIMASDIDAAMRQYEFLKENALTDMSYEQWLSTFGVRPKKEELHIPELLRFQRDWQYPTNTVNPSTGAPTSAVSWAIQGRADKDRFFREPGFIVGVSLVRPKTYRRKQDGSGAGMLDTSFSWLPALMQEDPATSLRKFAETAGPLQTAVTDPDGYVVDMRDLYVWGDQYINFDPTGDKTLNATDIPTTNIGTKRYPSATDCAQFFVDDAGTAITIKQDGIASLAIAGKQVDTTPQSGMIKI